MIRTLSAIALAAGLAACQTAALDARPAPASLAAVPAFAQAVCGDCHALAPPDLSPNPEAPAFVEIANRPGLTAETLSHFLGEAHNYPQAMEFTLDATHVEQLTAYILTLQDANYQLPSS